MLYKKKEVSFDHNCILRTDFLKLSLFFFRSGVKSCVNPVTDTTETTKESHQNSSKNEASEATGCSVGTTWIDPAQTYWLWKKNDSDKHSMGYLCIPGSHYIRQDRD